jgi:hypothetical protein
MPDGGERLNGTSSVRLSSSLARACAEARRRSCLTPKLPSKLMWRPSRRWVWGFQGDVD